MALNLTYTFQFPAITAKTNDAADEPDDIVVVSTTDNIPAKSCVVKYIFRFSVSGSAGAWSYYEFEDNMSLPLMFRKDAKTILESFYNSISGDVENLIANKEFSL